MKRFLLFIVFVAGTLFSQAQVFEMYTPEGALVNNGDTVFVNGVATDDLLAIHVHLKNVSAVTQSVYAKKRYVYVVPGVFNAFCWAGACYTSFEPNNYADLDAGTTNEEFSTEYMPQGNEGISVIRYTFYTQAGDSAWFFGKYNIWTTGIGTAAFGVTVSNPFPVPARENVNFVIGNVYEPVSIEIHDLTGKQVKLYTVNQSGLIQLPVNDLKRGLYIAEVKAGVRTIKTSKIVIR